MQIRDLPSDVKAADVKFFQISIPCYPSKKYWHVFASCVEFVGIVSNTNFI